MPGLHKIKLVLTYALCALAFSSATFWYCGFPLVALVFGGLAIIPLIVLSALGWTQVWDALENGKFPF